MMALAVPSHRRLAKGALLFVATVLLIPSAGAAQTRQDVDNGDYLEGRLTWRQNQGGISWGESDSQDPGGPGPVGPTNQDQTVTYTSVPLPRTLHLNASRHIQLELYWKREPMVGAPSNSCNFRARLFSDDRLLGGVLENQIFDFSSGFFENPPGFWTCHLRMAPEIAILPEGAVVRLSITHSRGALFGMGEGHQSLLRLPFFDDDELPYRYPLYAHGGPSTGTGDPSSLDGLLSLLGAAAVGASVLPRTAKRSEKAMLLALLWIGVALGGCIGAERDPAVTPGAGGVVQTSVAPVYQEGNLSQAGFGSLIGTVTARDVGQPLMGAFVTLLATDHSTRTDPYGRFVFRDLEPRTYHLRVDRDGFQSFEARVPVAKDLIARVHVELVPLAGAEAGGRPHRHDYWQGQQELTIMNKVPIGSDCPQGAAQASNICRPRTSFVIPPASNGITSILPGTYEITVILEWEARAFAPNPMGLLFQANNDASLANWTELIPRAPGEPYHLVTTWEMADAGHQPFSTWVFDVTNTSSGPNPYTQTAEWLRIKTSPHPANINVTMKIRRGVVPLEPAHPDPWKGKEELAILSGQSYLAQEATAWSGQNWHIVWLPSRSMPPETTWIEATAVRSNTPAAPYDVNLRYRTAAGGAPSAACWSTPPYNGQVCDGPEYAQLGTGTTSGVTSRWVIPIEDGQQDPVYALRSFWVFVLSPASDSVTRARVTATYGNNYVNHFVFRTEELTTYNLTVIAHQGPMPT